MTEETKSAAAAPEARGPDAPSEWPQEVRDALTRFHSVFGCYCNNPALVAALNDLVAAALRAHPAGEPSEREARLREIEATIADYGWSYGGALTFTVNCTDIQAARRLSAALRDLPRAAPPPEGTSDE